MISRPRRSALFMPGDNSRAQQKATGLLADVIILVTAPPAVRKKRIIHRNQLSEDEAEQRIAAQTPDTQQAQWADYLLENTGTQAALTRQAENLWNQIVKD